MIRRALFLLALAPPLALASVALAGGGDEPKKDEPGRAAVPAAPKAKTPAGPEIAWATSYAEAKEDRKSVV